MIGTIIKVNKTVELVGGDIIPVGTEGFIYAKEIGEGKHLRCVFRNGVFGYLYEKDFEIVNQFNSNIMQKLTTALKRVLSKSLQTQYRAGIRNDGLSLTERGKEELLEIIAKEKEEELTEVANAILEEEK